MTDIEEYAIVDLQPEYYLEDRTPLKFWVQLPEAATFLEGQNDVSLVVGIKQIVSDLHGAKQQILYAAQLSADGTGWNVEPDSPPTPWSMDSEAPEARRLRFGHGDGHALSSLPARGYYSVFIAIADARFPDVFARAGSKVKSSLQQAIIEALSMPGGLKIVGSQEVLINSRVSPHGLAGMVAAHGGHPVTLQRGASPPVPEDEWIWVRILAAGKAFSYNSYRDYIKSNFSGDGRGVGAYKELKTQSENFMAGRSNDSEALKQFVSSAALELRSRLDRGPTNSPTAASVPENILTVGARLPEATENYVLGCLEPRAAYATWCPVELIWSYWHEEAMLVQSMKSIAVRFQNRRAPGGMDPLANFEVDPLRPLNYFIWGYIEDEQHRLSVNRRAHEYEHHYGLPLRGKAVNDVRPADRRSKFIESFHNLLHRCVQLYKQLDDLTVRPDGFPVLNAIKETHYMIAQGAHNQFGELPEVARREMLLEQYLLGRTETRDFLRARDMVPYPEDWMDRVDAMKNVQGWIDTSVVHFRDLAVFGEHLILSVRYGTWARQNDPEAAAVWARAFRQEVQGYLHAYRAVTGVDLASEITHPGQVIERFAAPGDHLRRRLAAQVASRR